MTRITQCALIENEQQLETTLKTHDTLMIMFYASWCPFCQYFLPIFGHCLQEASVGCYRMTIDRYPALCEKYTIEIYPTVLFFQQGKISKRLDGIQGRGITEEQLHDFLKDCDVKKVRK